MFYKKFKILIFLQNRPSFASKPLYCEKLGKKFVGMWGKFLASLFLIILFIFYFLLFLFLFMFLFVSCFVQWQNPASV